MFFKKPQTISVSISNRKHDGLIIQIDGLDLDDEALENPQRVDVVTELPWGWLGCKDLPPALPHPVTGRRWSDPEPAAKAGRRGWLYLARWHQRSLTACGTDYCCERERRGI